MQPTKTLNKFNRSHAGLRKFLRLVSYGCYHRTLFAAHAITPRSYDDFLRQVRFFIPEDNLQMTRHGKCVYFTFVGDFRHGTRNYFYTSFLLKTLLPEHCLQKIILLQVLEGAEPLPTPIILERAENLLTTHKPQLWTADLFQALRRRLNELADSGIVLKTESAKKIFYAKISNPLESLSASEVQILQDALIFLRNVAPIGTAGYFLCDSLKNFFNVAEPEREIFQFRNNNFAAILDDDILLTVAEALRLRRKIIIERENRPPLTVTPIAIETDFLCARRYLVALRQRELMRLRVEKISAVRLIDDVAENFSSARVKLREVRLRVKFGNDAERRLREKLLTDELPCRIVDITAGEFICAIETTDPLQIYPRLWQFQPWAEILSGADGLRERMRRDVEEVLKNYAEPV